MQTVSARSFRSAEVLTVESPTSFVTSLVTRELLRALRAVVEAAGREADRHDGVSATARARLEEVVTVS
jgi:hypothetical protein